MVNFGLIAIFAQLGKTRMTLLKCFQKAPNYVSNLQLKVSQIVI